MVPHRGAEKLLAAVPGSRLEMFDACGHCSQIEDPPRLVELVSAFGADLTEDVAAARR